MGNSLNTAQISTRALTMFSSEQLRESVRGSDFEHVQLSDGPFHGHLQQWRFGDSVLDSGIYSQDLLATGTFPADRITLGYIMPGGEAGYFNGVRLAAHDIIVIGEGGAMEPYRLPAGTQWIAFQTRRDLLEREEIPLPAPHRIMHYSGLSRATLRLSKYLKALVTPPSGSRSGSALLMPGDSLVLEDQLIAGFRRAMDAVNYIDPRRHRPRRQETIRILREFGELVAQNLCSELRIAELCAQIGTSQRTLEYFIKDYYGMSPQRYLAVHRLNAAHHYLLHKVDNNESIAVIADRFGFRHPGRFAEYYRKQFGESPSGSLKTGITAPGNSAAMPEQAAHACDAG